jgi:hypothetical protein
VTSIDISAIVPGGILPTDHRHDFTNDGTCSRCRKPIPEHEVPIICWTHGGRRMLIYCNPCTGVPRTHYCSCCGEECPDGKDCCSDEFPEPGDIRETGP